jgi:hypothetical protein
MRLREALAGAEKGDAEAQGALGWFYLMGERLMGEGTEGDYKQAVFWFQKAAAHGSIENRLTMKLWLGLAEAMLPAQNFRELFEGAQKGNANFQYGLGFAYLKGLGTEFNLEQAVFWFQKAAAQSHVNAQKALGSVQNILATKGAEVENFNIIWPTVLIRHRSLPLPIVGGIVGLLVYLSSIHNIGWLRSLEIIFNIGLIVFIAAVIIYFVLAHIWPRRSNGIMVALFFLALIPTIGLGVHYVKGRKTGNPVSIILENPYAAITRAFVARKGNVERSFALDIPSENGAAKIFEVRQSKEESVISLIRTTGSHRAVSIAPPGAANSFYVKDTKSGKTWPLKEMRPQDYEDAAGVELVFDLFTSRSFDLVEGNDTSTGAWHFRNVAVMKK